MLPRPCHHPKPSFRQDNTIRALSAALLAAALPATAYAQDGAAPGVETAGGKTEIPDPASPIFEGEQQDGFPTIEADEQLPSELPQSEQQDSSLPGTLPPPPDGQVAFEADAVEYASDGDTVTATGNVILREENAVLRSDTVVYDRKAGIITASGNTVVRTDDQQSVRADRVIYDRIGGGITATGNVRFVDAEGNQLFTDTVQLTDAFEVGSMEDLLLSLREGGRLAARSGERLEDGSVQLRQAAYSACAVETSDGCPKKPSWRVTAREVNYSAADKRIRFEGARLELFGLSLLPLPGLTLNTDGEPVSGFLIPNIRFSESNGVEVSGSYYWKLAENKELTASAYVFSDVPPMVSAQWKHLTDKGAYQVTGYGTYSRRISSFTGIPTSERDPRGYLFANGRFQFDPNWSFTGSARIASDRTFLRRYDISRDDRLRSIAELERIDRDSYFSLAGYATQTLRLNADQGQVPIALPVLDYRRRLADPVLGGKVELQVNTLAITRTEGQDTQRAFAGARWDLRKLTPAGQAVTFTALARGDVYHSDQNDLTLTPSYRGDSGWQARAIGLVAADVQWPFVGEAFGGTQVLTPRVQFVASPPIRNLAIPNEDSRAVDLEDSNLFALNRFPGYDRVEDGARITYGADWQLTIPGWRLDATVGQTYRLDNQRNLLPSGTGLSDQFSDFVGRTRIRYRDFLKFTHRYRLDKDNLAIRRNEFDATVGTARTYGEIGYLRLNRNITTVEDLQDREELRLAGRVAFADYWSIFGSGVFNLTDREEDPLSGSDGFEAVRTRLGFAYQDDCLELGFTWRRDFADSGDARRGNTFQLNFALRNLGFR